MFITKLIQKIDGFPPICSPAGAPAVRKARAPVPKSAKGGDHGRPVGPIWLSATPVIKLVFHFNTGIP